MKYSQHRSTLKRLIDKQSGDYKHLIIHKLKLFQALSVLLPIVIGIAFSFMGCKKFVKIDPPVTMLSSASVYESASTATSAQLAIYNSLLNNQGLIGPYLTAISDELTNYSSDGNLSDFYRNAYLPQNSSPSYLWNRYFNYIFLANAVLEGLAGSQNIDGAIKKQLEGEALFSRAFAYSYLVNAYGAVPLMTSTDYMVNSQLSRSSVEVVTAQIIADLKNAQALLNSNYVDISDTAVSNDRVRPNLAAANALLARMYLYKGDYDNAAAMASTVINNPLYKLETNLNNVFLSTSHEAIWQLSYPTTGITQSVSGRNYILLAAPSNRGSQNCFSISPHLMNSFETGDNRKTSWISSITTTSPVNTYYFPYKYQVYDNSHNPNNRKEYEMVLRLAEQYLIRAEAEVHLGNTSLALADLNTIRNRAGLANYSGATDQASLLGAILHERQVELFTEWGHRWFDLKRTNNLNTVMSLVAPTKTGTWNPDGHQQLLPIPNSEMGLDLNLTQNAGY